MWLVDGRFWCRGGLVEKSCDRHRNFWSKLCECASQFTGDLVIHQDRVNESSVAHASRAVFQNSAEEQRGTRVNSVEVKNRLATNLSYF
jgi:hypothetical protein